MFVRFKSTIPFLFDRYIGDTSRRKQMYPILSIEVQIPPVFVPNIEDIPLQRESSFGGIIDIYLAWLLAVGILDF